MNVNRAPEKPFPVTRKELERFCDLFPIHAAVLEQMIATGEAELVPGDGVNA